MKNSETNGNLDIRNKSEEGRMEGKCIKWFARGSWQYESEHQGALWYRSCQISFYKERFQIYGSSKEDMLVILTFVINNPATGKEF